MPGVLPADVVDRPRLMVTYRFVRRDVAREIGEGMGWIKPPKAATRANS